MFHMDKGHCWVTYFGADTSFFDTFLIADIWMDQALLQWHYCSQDLEIEAGDEAGVPKKQSCCTIGWGKWCNGFHWSHSPRLFGKFSQSDEQDEPGFIISIQRRFAKRNVCESFRICNAPLSMADLESLRLDAGSDLLFYIEIDAPGNCWSWCIPNVSFLWLNLTGDWSVRGIGYKLLFQNRCNICDWLVLMVKDTFILRRLFKSVFP